MDSLCLLDTKIMKNILPFIFSSQKKLFPPKCYLLRICVSKIGGQHSDSFFNGDNVI